MSADCAEKQAMYCGELYNISWYFYGKYYSDWIVYNPYEHTDNSPVHFGL